MAATVVTLVTGNVDSTLVLCLTDVLLGKSVLIWRVQVSIRCASENVDYGFGLHVFLVVGALETLDSSFGDLLDGYE